MKKSIYLLLSLTIVFLTSCNNTDDANSHDNLFKFKEYIRSNTYGNQSIATNIRVDLAQPLEQFTISQEIDASYFKISPKTEGKLYIDNGNILVFNPSKHLTPDTEYTVSVQLHKLYDITDKAFKEYTFSFKTIPPGFKIDLGNLQSYSKEWQYQTGVIKTSDIVSLEKAKQLVNAFQKGKKLTIKWGEGKNDANYFDFTIDSIQRFTDDSKIEINWNGKAIGSDIEGNNEVTIPGKNNFTVVSATTLFTPKTALTLNFSDPLKENQNFKGLITLEKAENLRFEVDGNILHIYPGNRIVGNVRVTLFNGIKNTEGFQLKKEFSELVSFEQLKPALELISKGVILPDAQATPIYFRAVNLSAVDVRIIKIYEDNVLQFLQSYNLNNTGLYDVKRVGRRVAKKTINLTEKSIGNDGLWKAYGINLSDYFITEPGSLYRIELSFKQEYTTYNCEATTSQESSNPEEEYYEEDYYYDAYTTEIPDGEDDELEERFWDNEIYSYRREVYNWQERDNPCHPAYYNSDRIISTNVLGSNLGLIVKKGNNKSYHFAVSNLLTTEPQPNTKIKLYNYQQQLIGTTDTDGEGLAIFDSEKNIAFAVAQKANNYAYAKLADGNALSLSNFDVSGKTLKKGLKGFIYTERGVHRPGDSIHLTFAFNDKNNPLPTRHPVKLEVTDARGKLVKRVVVNEGVNDFYYFPIKTNKEDPTGNWNATISVGGISFSKNLKVATVKPNRLKLQLDFKDEILDANKPIKGTVKALWLHGAPARNLKIEMGATLRSSNTVFKGFENYQFNDPVKIFNETEVDITDGTLSQEGTTSFSNTFKIGKGAPGMLKATFLTKVFEGGGDFSMDVFTKDLAPYSHFVGLKSPKPHSYGSYHTDQSTEFQVASVNAQGKGVSNRKLNVEVFKIEWRWWWNRGNDNLSRYENSSVHKPYKSFTVSTNGNGKANFKLNIPDNDGGRFLIRVKDEVSGHATGRTTYFYRNWWNRPSDENSESSKMLIFTSNKKKYDVGETAKISFPSGGKGRSLISIENGTEVLSQQWVTTKTGETEIDIPITKEMTPNVFVNISLLQPHEQTANDLPIRLYGVVPILVEDSRTVLHPVINMPEVLQPEETFAVKISEKDSKAMTYTIAIVDEGLLDLTRFKTPDIHNAFFTREALGVKTFDIYDYVIGAYSDNVDNIYAIGGGDDAAGAKNRKADRFKPVVHYLGPFYLKAGQTETHNITMPNYIGSVRTMVVAGDHKKNAYGNSEKTTPVRKPLMVLASLPRKLSPGEKVTLPVTVFAMEKKVRNAKITVKASEAFKPIGVTSKTVSFPEIGEQIVNFEFEMLPTQKLQKIKVIAEGAGERNTYDVEIDVENPNPITQQSTGYTLEPNSTKTIDFTTFGIVGTNEAALEFSTLPPMDFERRLGYLIHYPHGCIEQTTSGAFPQLLLDNIFDITFDKKQDIKRNIEAAIQRLNNFQVSSGGLSYWPGERQVDDWGTNYAGHFMLEAKQKGYALPITFLTNWLRYQQAAARQWRQGNTRYNSSITQAYRLYTLALANKPELAAMNRLRESKNISNDAKWRLAAAYALIGKKNVAQEILQSANINFVSKRYDYHTYGSPFRNRAMALETMVILEDNKQRDLSISLAKNLSSQRWYSTQETAYALLALSKMIQKNGGKSIDISYSKDGKITNLKTDKTISQRDIAITMGTNSVTITNKKDNVVFVNVSQKGKLPIGTEQADRKNLVIQSQYQGGDGTILDVTSLRQGTEITAVVKITNTSNDNIDNVALTKIFPSGWEIVNTSFTELAGGAKGEARYTDIRDDRVQFYFDLKAKESKSFAVKLNASYLGMYYLPGTQVEAMYDNNYYARNKGIWVTVKQ